MILKKGLLTELERKKKKKDSQKDNTQHFLGRACFGWVGRSTENQHFLGSAWHENKKKLKLTDIIINLRDNNCWSFL